MTRYRGFRTVRHPERIAATYQRWTCRVCDVEWWGRDRTCWICGRDTT